MGQHPMRPLPASAISVVHNHRDLITSILWVEKQVQRDALVCLSFSGMQRSLNLELVSHEPHSKNARRKECAGAWRGNWASSWLPAGLPVVEAGHAV